jgi:exodeoxyribonuclease V alpha subunit
MSERLRTAGGVAPLHPLGTARQRLTPAPVLSPAATAALAEADLGEEAAFVAWQVGQWAGDVAPSVREALTASVAASLAAVAQGSTRVAVAPAPARALAGLPELVGAPGARTPFILDGGWLYQQRHHASERRIAEAIARRREAGGFPAAAVQSALADVFATAVPVPSEDQQAAVTAALGGRLAAITGGPGTGKTTIVFTLLRALVRLGVAPQVIALAAPTGKAANRLDEAIKAGAQALAVAGGPDQPLLERPPAVTTLHRLLGYSPGARAFAHHAGSPLPHRVVIVDEGSMVDLQLMDRLLEAVHRESTLVLLGDADQLPSVDAGAVFRDLAPLAVRLTRSHRLDPERPRGRQVLELAAEIRAGKRDAARLMTAREQADALDFGGAELLPAAAREDLLERWYTDRVAALPDFAARADHVFTLGASQDGGFSDEDAALLDALFAHHQGHRLLAVTRGRATGAEALNTWLHQRSGDAADMRADVRHLHPGEPVMMLHNDYERGLWNGDQGLIVRVREPRRAPRAAAVFKARGRWNAWHLESLGESLALAFALTVHKAQGSEYDDVALVLPETPLPLLTRELLYTAVTRSRRSLVICGSPEVLAAGATRPSQRSTGIAERLGATSP